MGAPLGNKNASHARRWRKAIERALSRVSNQDIEAGLDLAADQLVKASLNGDAWALKELGDRIEGKSVQPIVGDEDSPPIQVTGAINLVRPT